ncbi:cytosolic sulfotransferase 15-like [Lycium barbarum]|uniref:cytosolic sulfotransferase 15-like n=1 Tax=Lycium barbarum TaxID=112863 RepID=UPI00293EEFBA|nr:cytosolic sulfotransferase 15-like [Lycium barbarum]
MTISQTSQPLPPKYLQEDDLNEECKKFLSILPKEKGWIESYIYNYQGFWTAPRVIQGVIACQQQFQAQNSDIILVTTPKSGTTWLKSLLFSLVNRMKHPIFKQNHPLLVQNPHDLVPFLERRPYVDGQVPNGPFWNHVLDYWKECIKKPHKVHFLMYEEIKKQPKIQLKRLAEFLECPFSIEEENCELVDEILRMWSFENLSNLEVNINGKLSTGPENKLFFRKGEVEDWKNYFTIEMSEKLNHVIEQTFQGSGLKFLYT